MVNVMPRPPYPQGIEPVHLVQEAGAENLITSGIRSPTVHLVASRYTDYASPGHPGMQLKLVRITTQPGQPAPGPRFKPGTHRVQMRCHVRYECVEFYFIFPIPYHSVLHVNRVSHIFLKI